MTNAATLTYACDPQNASCGGHKCASSHKVNAPFAPREASMLSGFKQFILRGNVVDLAVGVVIGAAFASVVTAFTKDLLTPLIAAVVKAPNFAGLKFTINGSEFMYGEFLNALVSFLLVAAAVYFFVV